MEITPQDIDAVCGLVIDLCGIYLDESKGYLIESRLCDIVQQQGCRSYVELVNKARYTAQPGLQAKIIDAMTTNETLFFRDGSPFQALQHKVFPELIDAKAGSLYPQRLRIWSAACSTGQEPYSVAMTLCELIPNIHAWDISILATDISSAAIERASKGWYAKHEIERGMEREALAKYFVPDRNGWKVKDELRSLVSYQRLNLMEPFNHVGSFDVVLCRNVVIYFTPKARRDVFNRIADTLNTEGVLFVGSSESLADLGARFTPQHHCRSVFYRPNQQRVGVLA